MDRVPPQLRVTIDRVAGAMDTWTRLENEFLNRLCEERRVEVALLTSSLADVQAQADRLVRINEALGADVDILWNNLRIAEDEAWSFQRRSSALEEMLIEAQHQIRILANIVRQFPMEAVGVTAHDIARVHMTPLSPASTIEIIDLSQSSEESGEETEPEEDVQM